MKPSPGTRNSSSTAKAQYYFCGIDIGGTFTDCVVRDNHGRLTIAKALSTPHDSSEGFFNALTAAAEKMGITLTDLLSKTRHLMHGTTLGTNALLERKGAKTGLITTRGHADAIIMMRSVGRSAGLPIHRLHHVSRHQKPDPIVPRSLICEVSERMDWSGEVVLPLNEEETRQAVRHLVDSGVGAIGICFLWGFVNPAHELAVKRIVQQMAPDMYVTCGHELVAKPGEYERIAAVAINCFIGPLMSRYLHKIEEKARDFGYRRPLVIMQASGGVAGAEDVADRPLFTIGSGPAGGLTACGFLAKQLGHRNVLASDVGGTSFDVGLIHEGQPLSTSQSTINQYTFSVPHLDIESIGSGGGSLIWVDERSGTLKVGPESAGSNPGPVCYGHGGQRPTVTDANLVLGYYDPNYFLGGKLTLDKPAAHAALERVGRELGMTAIEAAAGAIRIVEFQMAELMRQMSVQRGLDPREFVVYSYGGAAGAHAATYARELGVTTVVVPLGSTASTWSALGVQAADLIHVYEKAELMIAPFNAARINEIFSALEKKGRAQLRKDGIASKDIFLERHVEMKFKLQIHLVEVPVREGKLTARHLAALQNDFVEKYERTHGRGSAFTGAGTEIGLFRVVARGRMERPAVSEYQRQHTAKAAQSRSVYWPQKNGFRNTPIYDASSLKAGHVVRGPAIIQMPETTLVVPPFAHGGFDKFGNIVLRLTD
jgi:N-methylhydantoinase A